MTEQGVKPQGLAINQSQSPGLPVKGPPPSKYIPYPVPLARYEEVVASRQVFMSSLEQLHFAMGTKFMIPTIGGRELDLHRLFVEVTSRGGIEKILQERRWKEVTAVFSFPSTATNASFVLRKYYGSLLHHYEQIYYFKARGWIPSSIDAPHTPYIAPALAHDPVEPKHPSPEIHFPGIKQPRISPVDLPQVNSTPSAGSSVIGVIDGKFDSGYLVTVTIGSEKLKGVLYRAPNNAMVQMPPYFSVGKNNNENVGVKRRRRRKKSEIKRRDPAHPKPNRSGYNFFFAEQHARLKLLHPGKDRQISRMIGELWTKLKDNERAVYQEKALEDKERYRIEMEGYRERQKLGQVISNAVPIQQVLPDPDVEMVEIDVKAETEEGDPLHTVENESTSGKTDSEDDNALDEDLDMAVTPDGGVAAKAESMVPEASVEGEACELGKRVVKGESEEGSGHVAVERIVESVPSSGP